MAFKFGASSLKRLEGVHPDLVKVAKLALEKSESDFSVLEGVRTLERQKMLVAKKMSQTLDSKHIKQSDGFGHAIDITPFPISWDIEKFYPLAEAMRKAAKELGVRVRWGGCWKTLNDTTLPCKQLVSEYSAERRAQGKKAFIDGPHFELA